MISDKKVEGKNGIVAGGNVTFGDVSGQVAVGSHINQTQTLSSVDITELQKSLSEFKEELAKLKLSKDDAEVVNGDVAAAIKETKKEKPDTSKIKSRVESALDTIKEVGDTIEKVSKWESTKKILTVLGKIGKAIIL